MKDTRLHTHSTPLLGEIQNTSNTMKVITPITIDNVVACVDDEGNKKYIVGDYDDTYGDIYRDYCGHFYTFHPRYSIGECHRFRETMDFWKDFFKQLGKDCPDTKEECWLLANSLSDYCFVPVYAIIHGTIYLSLSDPQDPWDSCLVGLIYCSNDDYNRYFLDKNNPDWKIKYKEYAKDWIEEENDVLNGQTYGFIIADASELEPYKDAVESFYPEAWTKNLRKAVMAHEELSCFGFHGDYEKLLMEFLKDEGLRIEEVL